MAGKHRGHATFDVDDIEQACRIAALLLLRRVEPTERHPLGFSLGTLGHVMRWRAIDWLREVNPVDQGKSAGKVLHTVSMEEATVGGMALTLESTLADPTAEDPFIDLENHDAIQWAIDNYQGPPWHIELSLLVAHGLPLHEAGDAYGVTESRACQVMGRFARGVRLQLDATGQDWRAA